MFDYSFSYLLGALKSCNEFHNQFNGVNSKIVEQLGGRLTLIRKSKNFSCCEIFSWKKFIAPSAGREILRFALGK